MLIHKKTIKKIVVFYMLVVVVFGSLAENLIIDVDGNTYLLPISGEVQIDFDDGDVTVSFNEKDENVRKVYAALQNNTFTVNKSKNYLHDQNDILENNKKLERNSYLYILVNSTAKSIKSNVNIEIQRLIENLNYIKSGFCQLPKDLFFNPGNLKCNNILIKKEIEFGSKGEVVEYILILQKRINILESNVFNLRNLISHVEENFIKNENNEQLLKNESLVIDGFDSNVNYYKEMIRDLKVDLNIEMTMKNTIKTDLELMKNKYNDEKDQNIELQSNLKSEIYLRNLLIYSIFTIVVSIIFVLIVSKTLKNRNTQFNNKLEFLKKEKVDLSNRLNQLNYLRVFLLTFTSLTVLGFAYRQLFVSNIQMQDLAILIPVILALGSIPYFVHKIILSTKQELINILSQLD